MGDDFSDVDWEDAYTTKCHSAQGAAEEFTDEEIVVVRNKATGEISHWRVEPETIFNAYEED